MEFRPRKAVFLGQSELQSPRLPLGICIPVLGTWPILDNIVIIGELGYPPLLCGPQVCHCQVHPRVAVSEYFNLCPSEVILELFGDCPLETQQLQLD